MSEIRDTIYGFIEPYESELKIINTSLFQRLRRIKQLAMAYLVYPGANHTRFDHSLGVYHITSLMAEKLLHGKVNKEKRNIVRLAALLHDIGHGPFSHVSEDILDKYSQIANNNINNKNKIHEKIAVNLIESDKELSKILSPNERDQIIGLLSGKSIDLSLMKEIVSGPIDADKQDYLLRDSHFCGVKDGIYDFHRLINTLAYYSEGEDKHIAVKFDGVNTLEQFVLAKYYMTTQVYRHKIRLVSDAMIIRGIELGIEKDEINWLRELYTYNNSENYLINYLNWYDERLIGEIVYNQKKGVAKEIFDRLHKRNLFKTVFSFKFKDLPETVSPQVKNLMADICSKENNKRRVKMESDIAQLLDTRPEFTIVNSFTFKSVKEMSNSEGPIMIIKKDEKIDSFEQESTVFRAIDEKIKDKMFEIYTPMEYSNNIDKSEKLSKIKKDIIDYLSREMKEV